MNVALRLVKSLSGPREPVEVAGAGPGLSDPAGVGLRRIVKPRCWSE